MKYSIYLTISYTTIREHNISDNPRLLSRDNVMPLYDGLHACDVTFMKLDGKL